MSLTVLARPVDIIRRLIDSYGHDPDPLFRELHIDPAIGYDPNARYSARVIDELWKGAAKLIADPCFGLRAPEHWHPSHMHALAYAWLASSTLRTALLRLNRYIKIINDETSIQLEESADGLSVVLAYARESKELPWRTDLALSILIHMCRLNYGGTLDPVSVSFEHSEPPCAGDFFACFRCPVHFDAPRNQLTLASEVLDRRLAGDNPELARLNDQVMIQYLARLDRENILERVQAAIIDHLPSGRVTDQTIAEALFMNVRSLQRKLRNEGTTFKALLDGVRQELADQYIRDSRLNVNEISFLLGFSDISSFSRAFKRWTGEPPSAYRQPG